MNLTVRVPMVSVNEEEVTLVEWRHQSGARVRKGETICSVETTKASVEIEAEADGYIIHRAKAGEKLKTGAPLGVLSDSPDGAPAADELTPPAADAGERRWTKKAALLAKRMGIDLEAVAAQSPGKVIGEADVLARQNGGGKPWVERVLILGGGSAAIQILDVLARVRSQAPAGVLDDDPNLSGKSVMGARVLGTINDALDVWKSGVCDAMIVAVGMDLNKRAELFERLSAKGIKFTNVVDITADFHQDVSIGAGNVILSHTYLGPYARLGDNNFLSSFTCLEHHTQVGSHCLFGPSVSTSGYVTIGDKVRFGTHVGIEPQVRVGNGALIASGSILTADVAPDTVVKSRYTV